MKNRITNDFITELKENEIFGYGSNKKGAHVAGAAKTALKWGAKHGIGIGIQGQTYGIPTKDHNIKTISLEEIKEYIDDYILFAENNPQFIFLTTEIGCGLANLTPEQIAPLFKKAIFVENIHLPAKFWNIIKSEICDPKELKTSQEWYDIIPKEHNLEIIDPDGWDRTNYEFSFNKERISKDEFDRRLMSSTIMVNTSFYTKS